MAAAARPKFKFKGASEVAPKISVASEAEAAEHTAGDQTSDFLALTRRAEPPASGAAPPEPVPELPPKATEGEGMFAKKEKKKKTAKPVVPAVDDGFPLAPLEPAKEEVKAPFDISKLSDDLQDYATDILKEDYAIHYEDPTARPIFPLQTRLGFQQKILQVYKGFQKVPDGAEPDYDMCKKLSEKEANEVEIYQYQKFVRDYTRQASPYRGLLVYHGLGSGKTCSAIAAAEALFSVTRKKIIVMTPASLRDNFIREISFCGFRHFRLQNFWVPFDVDDPTVKLFATEVLGVPESFVRRAERIWIPDYKEAKPNFNDLESDFRQEIIAQVKAQINERIDFISYNGISATKLKAMACQKDADGYGYFDNKIIVIDEFHNMVRMMQGSIEPYLVNLPGLKRKVPVEPVEPGPWNPKLCDRPTDPRRPYLTNYKRAFLFYRLLAGARNSKIIALSGTPLINFPEEIAIIANVLGGYIQTASFSVKPSTEANKRIVEKLLQDNQHIDFIEVDLQGGNMYVSFSLMPEGMVKVRTKDGSLGTQRLPGSAKSPSLKTITDSILAELAPKGILPVRDAEFKAEPLLPPVGEIFRDSFLMKESNKLKNKIVLQKRLQGLISYYRGSKPELMPLVTRDEVVKCPLTSYSQAEYQRVRSEEINQTIEKKKKGAKDEIAGVAGKQAALWAQIYELTSAKQTNSYRIYSRQACNFTFPESITRPRPTRKEDLNEEIGFDRDLFMDAVAETSKGEEELALGPGEEDTAAAEAEEEAIDESAKEAAVAEAKEEGDEEEAEAIKNADTPILIPELEAVAAEPKPAVAAAPAVPGEKKTLKAADLALKKRAEDLEKCKRGQLPGEAYGVALRRAKNCLEQFAANKLRLYGLGKKAQAETDAGVPIDPERLAKYSPKFAQMLLRILQSPGSNLVYSNFKDMEGIGIFAICMRANDFDPIVIEADEAGGFRFSAATVKSLKKGAAAKVNRYLSFTGDEARPIREMALKVFNARYAEDVDENGDAVGRFTELPSDMSDVLVEAGFKGNLNGELCRVFCITGAGAEGLSLRNVRRVHIMEPHWNHVRTDQVKGRAVRICSHTDLEWNADPALNQRTVEVFTYVSTFDPEALIHAEGGGVFPRIDSVILNGDGMGPEEAATAGFTIPPGAKYYVLTTDEYLNRISTEKKNLLGEIQDVMKKGAVDCQINLYENVVDGEPEGCVVLPGNPEQFAYHPVLNKDIAKTSIEFREAAAPVAPAPVGEREPGVESPAAVPLAPKAMAKATIKAKIITYGGKQYLAVPVKEKASGTVLRYDLFARGDTYRTQKLGTALADVEGNITDDITLLEG